MKRKLFALASTLFIFIGMPLLCYLSFGDYPVFASLMFIATLLTIAFKRGWTFMFMVNRNQPAYYFERGKEKISFSSWTWNSLFPVRIGIGYFSLAIYHVDAEIWFNYLSADNTALAEYKKQHLAASTPKRGSIAVCSSGFVGLITHDNRQEIAYGDGNKGFAYIGVQLFKDCGYITITDKKGRRKEKFVRTQVGGKWSDRNPRVIGEIDIDHFPYVDSFGVDGWDTLCQDPANLRVALRTQSPRRA